MKLTIERAALLKALGHVQSVVERRNTIPILSNVLLTAERERVGFSATDLDMEIIDGGAAQVDVPGQITAPAHTLYEIVRSAARSTGSEWCCGVPRRSARGPGPSAAPPARS